MRMLQRNLNELGTELRRREMIEEFLSLFEKFDSYFTGEKFVSSHQTVNVILWLKIHRTLWLARGDWSKCITRPIIPQLKLGNIRENHLRDALQLSNLTSVTTKFSLRWESVVWLLQTKENFCLFIKSLKKKLSKKTSHAASGELFVNMFSRALQDIWRIINTIASVWR